MSALHVLLVEDDPHIRRALDLLLQRLGHRVTPTASVAEAIARAADPHDLAMIDVWLPDGSGVDVLADLRARRPDTRVAMMSASTRDVADLVAPGGPRPDAFFRKPIDLDALLAWLDAAAADIAAATAAKPRQSA